jgi:hypothetical protein
MLLTQFLLENFHFGVNIFASLVFFAVFWLYFDAYTQTRSNKELLKISGFLLLSISFLINSTYIDQSILTNPVLSQGLIQNLSQLVKFVAYILLILGLLLDPIEEKPKFDNKLSAFFPLQILINTLSQVLFIFFSFFVFVLYLRRATVGLEKHLKPLTFGFFFIFLYEIFSLSRLFENTSNIAVLKIFGSFGPVWILSQIFLTLAVVIIGKWVFGYLLKRLESQIFMIFISLVVVIFLITTVSFTGLLLKSLENDALSHLSTDVSVVKYAILSKQAETLSDAEVVSQNPQIQNATGSKDSATLKNLSTSILVAKKQAFLTILSASGAVLARGEDSDRVGDSLSNDPLFVRSVKGDKSSSILVKDGALSPVVMIESAAPIYQNGQIAGVVIIGVNIDNAFVDGLKSATDLDVSVYGGNVLSATTFVSSDGKSRLIGVKQEDNNVRQNVLIEGKNYSSELNIINTSFLASFAPLKDINANPVGMLFVGKHQISVIQTASSSIEYTFIIAAFLILLSIIPFFFISRFITNQFK